MLAKLQLRRPSMGTVLGGLALLVATSGVAVAAIPGADQTVTACLSNGGQIRVIDPEQGETCPSNQTTLKLASTDAAGKVANADRLDGLDSTDFLGSSGKAADADLLDGLDSTDFLGASAQAADADLLDGLDSTEFLQAGALPGKVTRYSKTVEVLPGATDNVEAWCEGQGDVAIGGGTHWGVHYTHRLAEYNTGILVSSNLFGHGSWIGVGTNDESVAMPLTTWVLCLNP